MNNIGILIEYYNLKRDMTITEIDKIIASDSSISKEFYLEIMDELNIGYLEIPEIICNYLHK